MGGISQCYQPRWVIARGGVLWIEGSRIPWLASLDGKGPVGAFAGHLNLLVMILMTYHPFSSPVSFGFGMDGGNDLISSSLKTLFMHLLRCG